MADGGASIGFLGAGRMASALARAWITGGLVPPWNVRASDPLAAAREAFQSSTGANALPDNKAVASASLLVLAVKPQAMPALCAEIAPHLSHSPLVVSIAAGVPMAKLSAWLGDSTRLVRVMPNTPCLVGASASAFSPGQHAAEADIATVQKLLDAVGKAVRLPESLLDAVTGLSGSGPAFAYAFIEALSDGGVRAGLPREAATMLAAQTVLGAARMVLESGLHPGELKDQVASPGGTTIAGLHALERAGLRGAAMDAVVAAALRATELGKGE
ncbi:MAG: pyrroline-5-carboxylate reductase [Gemmataceae bacterium]|nr:pyrroline-5-carboxylate reductase [Gemmataceae bacterium]